ncbi:unnamed protein product [Brugia timori]|uniref:Uncharacterized protein n=1 Tax=Brugia timori TaxID=42155 RepID=A0A0R3QYR8_9BILA|nr:unnamed protein product [Brugia timori]
MLIVLTYNDFRQIFRFYSLIVEYSWSDDNKPNDRIHSFYDNKVYSRFIPTVIQLSLNDEKPFTFPSIIIQSACSISLANSYLSPLSPCLVPLVSFI